MLKKVNLPKLIISILLCQIVGLMGTWFTFPSLYSWYEQLNKPSFNPPNWIFGPMWTLLYFLISISFYLLWQSKDNQKGKLMRFFLFHLVLNVSWSVIFFGFRSPGVAFFEILLIVLTIIYLIIKLIKINKLAAFLLIPYLLWITFASILNFAIWRLNPNDVPEVFAQELTYQKAKEDFIFVKDQYTASLNNYLSKKDSYQKNPTLSLKEEARIALFDFINTRNNFLKSYLTLLRTKVVESKGLNVNEKEAIYAKIDPEVIWYEGRKDKYSREDSVENLINKSKEEDAKYETETQVVIFFGLSHINIGDVEALKKEHQQIYLTLKSESNELVKLGRADESLFERWFQDIDNQLNLIDATKKNSTTELEKLTTTNRYQVDRTFEDIIDALLPAKGQLATLNNYIWELENVIAGKR